MKKLLILFLLLTNSVIFAQNVGVLKDPILEFTPTLGHEQWIYQFQQGDFENHVIWNSIKYGGMFQLNEKRTWVTIKGDFLFNYRWDETFQSFWVFSYDWKVFKKELIYLQLKHESAQSFETSARDFGKVDGDITTVGIHYNNVYRQREYPDLVNFYGQFSYVIAGRYRFLDPPYLDADYSKLIDTRLGMVVNLWDKLFFEQNVYTYTLVHGWIRMTPQVSSFDTAVWGQFGNTRIGYKHVCYHSYDDREADFPETGGGGDHVFLEHKIQWSQKP